MRSFLVLLAAIALVSALTPQPYTHHAILDNVQAGTNSAAFGAAMVSLSASANTISYLIVNNVTSITQAHIHCQAIVNATTGVALPFAEFTSSSGQTLAVANNTLNLSNLTGISVADFILAMDNGSCYFNIHTTMFPGGEIRGQVLATGQQITSLTPSQEINVTSTATGVAWTRFDSASNNLTFILAHNVNSPTLAHIHGPAVPGVSASPIITIAGDPTSASKTFYVMTTTLSSDQVSWLNQGLLYYNVHSQKYGNGEIRGQINPIINYLGDLDGSQDNVSTSEQGVGLAALYGGSLWTAIYHNVAGVTASHIHTGAFGVPGGITFPYTNVGVVPISQNFTANSTQQSDLQAGNDYFNIHTNANINGEIRGQIYAKTNDGGAFVFNPPTPTSTLPTTTGASTTQGTTGSGSTGTTAGTTSSASSVICSAFVFVAVAALLA